MDLINPNKVGDYIAKNRFKKQWYIVNINGGEIMLKCFDLWIQIFNFEGKNFGLSGDFSTVSEFKNYINEMLKNYNGVFDIEIKKV